MNSIFISAIGVATNGMPCWNTARNILCGDRRYRPVPLERYMPAMLPPNEKRRSTDMVRLAFRVCEEIFSSHTIEAELLSVFTSSGGDYQTTDQICRVLRERERALSPTQFHNSVHNSAAGYWSIATKSMLPSTSLCCHDYSFAAGLLEATAITNATGMAVLLAAYDKELPEPLLGKRYIPFPFAVALLIEPDRCNDTLAHIRVETGCRLTETQCRYPDMEALRRGNPAARALPLLELIARKQKGVVNLSLPDEFGLKLEVDN